MTHFNQRTRGSLPWRRRMRIALSVLAVMAGAAGGAIAIIIVWLINVFAPGVAVPDAVAQAFTVLCTILAGLYIRTTDEGDIGPRRRR